MLIDGLFFTDFDFYFPLIETEKSSPFDHLSDLKELAETLTSADCHLDQWMSWKNDIKIFISEHSEDTEQLETFFSTITEWGIERNPQKTMAILTEIVSLDILTNVVRFKQNKSDIPFDNIFDWAAENAPLCPEPPDHSLKASFLAEWRRCRPLILYFIPNLVNIFLGAFNFLDSQKKFTTLWEKHLLLEIVYKFFIIPYCLVSFLQPILIVPAKVYLAAAGIIFATGILISCYQRWFRPLPDEIVNCTNLDKQMERGLIDPKVGQAKEIERLIAALEVDANVLLIGLSGEGKTALMHHLVQLKHQKELSEKLQKLTTYEVDCGLMISSVSFGHSDLINQIKDQINGHENEVLLFLDEFYQVATNKGAFQAFKKRFLEDKPHAKFVATITLKDFEELKKLDIDGSFRRRVVPIIVQSSSDEQNRLVIQDLIHRHAQDIPVTEDAIEAILEVSAESDYLSQIGRPAKAVKIFMDAIGLCRAVYNPHYVSVELSEARQEYQLLRLQAIQEVKANPETLKKVKEIKAQIEEIESELEQNKKQVQKIRKILAHQQKINSEYYRLTHLLARTVAQPASIRETKIDLNHLEKEDVFDSDENQKNCFPQARPQISKESISQKDQIMYLWYYFYVLDAIKKLVRREIDKVPSQMPVQVNADLIRRVYEESREIEKGLSVAKDKEKDSSKKREKDNFPALLDEVLDMEEGEKTIKTLSTQASKSLS